MSRQILILAALVAAVAATPMLPSMWATAIYSSTVAPIYDGAQIYSLDDYAIRGRNPWTGSANWVYNLTSTTYSSFNALSLAFYDATNIIYCTDRQIGVVNTTGGLVWKVDTSYSLGVKMCPVIYQTSLLIYDGTQFHLHGALSGTMTASFNPPNSPTSMWSYTITAPIVAYQDYYSDLHILNISATSINIAYDLSTSISQVVYVDGLLCGAGSYSVYCYLGNNLSFVGQYTTPNSNSVQSFKYFTNSSGMANIFLQTSYRYGIYSVWSSSTAPYWWTPNAYSYSLTATYSATSAYFSEYYSGNSFRVDFENPSAPVWLVGPYGSYTPTLSWCTNLDTSKPILLGSDYDTTSVVNANTGNPMFSFGIDRDYSQDTLSACYFAPNLFNGSFIVLTSTYSSAMSVFPNTTWAANITLPAAVTSPLAQWGTALYFGAGTNLCKAYVNNSTLAWCIPTLNTIYVTPTFANGNVYAVSNGGMVYVATPSGQQVTNSPVSVSCSVAIDSDNSPSTLVVSGTSVYFTYYGCLVRLAADLTVTKNTDSAAVVGTPTVSDTKIFVSVCSSGTSGCEPADVSSTYTTSYYPDAIQSYLLVTLTKLTTFTIPSTATDSNENFYSPIYLSFSDYVFAGTTGGTFYCLRSNAAAATTAWKYTASSGYSMSTYFGYFTRNLYVINSIGTVYGLTQKAEGLLSGTTRAIFTPQASVTSTPSGYSISPDGWIVVAGSSGISSVNAINGTSLWNVSSVYNQPQIYWGVVYAQRSSSFDLLDLYSGRVWMTMKVSSSFFNLMNSTITYAPSSDAELDTITVVPRLYTTLPPPINAAPPSLLEILEKNLTWIAGVVVGIVVIVVVVLVIKKFTGGAAATNQNDYQQMQAGGSKNAV